MSSRPRKRPHIKKTVSAVCIIDPVLTSQIILFSLIEGPKKKATAVKSLTAKKPASEKATVKKTTTKKDSTKKSTAKTTSQRG
jgi:hypothetical protein